MYELKKTYSSYYDLWFITFIIRLIFCFHWILKLIIMSKTNLEKFLNLYFALFFMSIFFLSQFNF